MPVVYAVGVRTRQLGGAFCFAMFCVSVLSGYFRVCGAIRLVFCVACIPIGLFAADGINGNIVTTFYPPLWLRVVVPTIVGQPVLILKLFIGVLVSS